MSLASLGSNYALRKVATEPPAGGSPAAQPSGVSQKSIDALVRWIPGETITLYAAIISISNTSLSKNQALAILLICLVINVGTGWSIAVHRAVQTLDPGRNWFSQFPTHVPVWEIALSSVALFRLDLRDSRLLAPAALVLGCVARRRRDHRHRCRHCFRRRAVEPLAAGRPDAAVVTSQGEPVASLLLAEQRGPG